MLENQYPSPMRARMSCARSAWLFVWLCALALIAPPPTVAAQRPPATPCSAARPCRVLEGTCRITPTNSCGTGSHSVTVAAGGGAGEGCFGHCSQVMPSPDTLRMSVASDGYTISGQRTTALGVNHVDTRSSCTKIHEVVVRGPMDGNYMDIARAAVPSGGLCSFNPSDVTVSVEPFSISEIKACPRQPVDKDLHVFYQHHSLVGGLSDDGDAIPTTVTVTAVVACVHGSQAVQVAVKDSCDDAVWPNHVAPKGHLAVAITPLPAPTDEAVSIMVTAKNVRTGAPVNGTATIMTTGHPSLQTHQTNQSFSAFLWGSTSSGPAAQHSHNGPTERLVRGHVTVSASGYCSAASSN